MNKISLIFTILVGFAGFTSCSSFEEPTDGNDNSDKKVAAHSCELILNVAKEGYGDEPSTRSAAGWADGDKIFLTFNTGSSNTYGDAVYANGKWTVNYYGSLTSGTNSNCSAVYFENVDNVSGSVVNLTENTAIYEDLSGTYFYNGESLTVSAKLKPKTGRIRFIGNTGDELTICGITHYTSYDSSTGKYSSSSAAVKSSVASGYTPYLYGYFEDGDLRRLNLMTSTSGFTRVLPANIFKAGESGYMAIPDQTSYAGWQNQVILKVNGVEFTMLPVYKENGSFLMAETETTKALYDAVMGTTTSGDSETPVTGISSYTDFTSKLKTQTQLAFDVPTFSEWRYAAIGGEKSRDYTYSGSNNIDDVAWYAGNSDGELHKVKQKQPNELGFYDMTGNAAEYASGSYYYVGGYYNSSESNCKIFTSGDYYNAYSTFGGVRLVIRL